MIPVNRSNVASITIPWPQKMRMEINSEDICIYTYMFESLVSALTSWEGSDWFNLIFSLLTRRKTKRKGEAKRKYAFCLHF